MRAQGQASRQPTSPAILRGRGIRESAEGGSSRGAGLLRFVSFTFVIAAAVVVLVFAIAAPVVGDTVYDFATSRPDSLRWPFVAGIVRDRLGASLTDPAGSDPAQVRFVVPEGASATQIGLKLEKAGLVRNGYAFVYLVVTQQVSAAIEAGDYRLSATMTPQQIVEALQRAPTQTVAIRLREGLRLEQITAYLETLPLKADDFVPRFYELVTHPPATLLAEFPWLELPEGRSLEGFLAPDTYEVWGDISPTDLVRRLVSRYQAQLGDDVLARIDESGRSLYEVVILASLVDREARLDEERPLIAGVFQNRLDRKMLLGADPTVIYAHDTMELAKLPLEQWVDYYFWAPVGEPLAGFEVPPELKGYQSYQVRGLPPGPIDTPRASSVEAALAPDTSTGYLYFVAIPDGSGRHAFAKTLKEHQANLVKYGYTQ